jgi:signal transduction histidine kinase
LAFSSSEELRPAAADLNASIQNTIELTARALGPEIRISLQLEPSVPPVFADVSGLESAMLNLLVNSRDAMPRGGVTTITSDVKNVEEMLATEYQGELKHGEYAYVSISDTVAGCRVK